MMARQPRPPPQDFPDDEVPSPFGPYSNPVDRFAHLPPATRSFFESLDKGDLEALECAVELLRSKEQRDTLVAILRSYRNAGIVGRFFRFMVVTAVAVFTTSVLLGERIRDVFSWFGGR
jgi:hypothetical protein